jgi:hypothetical protein
MENKSKSVIAIDVIVAFQPAAHPASFPYGGGTKGTYRSHYVNEKMQGLLCEKSNPLRIRNTDMQAAEVQHDAP